MKNNNKLNILISNLYYNPIHFIQWYTAMTIFKKHMERLLFWILILPLYETIFLCIVGAIPYWLVENEVICLDNNNLVRIILLTITDHFCLFFGLLASANFINAKDITNPKIDWNSFQIILHANKPIVEQFKWMIIVFVLSFGLDCTISYFKVQEIIQVNTEFEIFNRCFLLYSGLLIAAVIQDCTNLVILYNLAQNILKKIIEENESKHE